MDLPLSAALSLSSSGFATIATAYFWFVRANRERPKVNAYLEGTGRHEPWLEEDRIFEGTPEIAKTTYRLQFRLPMIVVNESIRPNAVVNVTGAVQHADGSWAECETSWDAGALPMSLAPEGTQPLDITLRTRRIFERDPDAEWRDSWIREIPRPARFRVGFQLLAGRTLSTTVTHTPLEHRIEKARAAAEEKQPKGEHHPPSGLRVRDIEDGGARAMVLVMRGSGYSGQTLSVDETITDAEGQTFRYKGLTDGRPTFTREANGETFRLRIEPPKAD